MMLPLLLAALPLVQAASHEGADHERPRDPFVFRSVLDRRARMITIALDDEMWIAYDATDCSLYKVWKGGANFIGPVYNALHGPQPTTAGKAYAEPAADGWRVTAGGSELTAVPRYLGYRVLGNVFTLRYELAWDGGSCVVAETPEFVGGDEPGLSRRFEAEGVPAGAKLFRVVGEQALEVEARGLLDTHYYPAALVAGVAAFEGTEPKTTADEEHEAAARASVGPVLDIPTTLVAPELDGLMDEMWAGAAAVQVGQLVFGTLSGPGDLSATARLCYDADHLYVFFQVIDDAVVNDSSLTFHDDGVEVYVDGKHERNDFYDENDAQYVFGFGDEAFWVTNQVALHPGVTFASRRTEVGYDTELALPWANLGIAPSPGLEVGLELHVDDDDDGLEGDSALAWFSTSSDSWSDPSLFATVTLGGASAKPRSLGPTEPGIALRAYQIGRELDELPRLVPGQSPNVNKLVPQVDLRTPADFGLEDQFVAELTGFLRAPADGVYGFRLTSDDGSRLWIDNWPVIDHDGLHSAVPLDGERELTAGEHLIRIDYFENTVGEVLVLEWRVPGAGDFEVVPPAAFSTRAGEVRVTAPGDKRVIGKSAVKTPGDRYPLESVHPSFDLTTLRPEGFLPKVGGMDFLPDGRLVLCTWDPDGAVYVLDGVQADDPSHVTVRRIAAGLAEPLGLKVVDGDLYVLQKQELTQLIDLDGDGLVDEYRCVSAGWAVTPNFHEFAFGLALKEDSLWATLAIGIEPGGASSLDQAPDRGRALKVPLHSGDASHEGDGSYELVAAGFRTPNGIGLGVDDQLFVTDNQGDWLPASKLVHLREGAFYGNRSVDPEGSAELVDTPPVVWLPQGEIGNSPSQPTLLTVGPWAGQMVHGEVTHGGLKRVFVEQVAGQYQGAVFRFTQGLEAGINRLVRAEDGSLYVGGIGSTGNWGQDGKHRYGLQRLRYNGASTFEMLAVRALANGLELEFTEPLAEELGWDPRDYEVRQWRYVPTREYGGPKVDEVELEVRAATVSADRRRVFLELPGLLTGHVVYVRLAGGLVSEAGRAPWSTEAWYTLNALPERAGVTHAAPPRGPLNVLTDEEARLGFELLFDGRSLERFRGFKRDDVPASWRAENGVLTFAAGEDRGDLITREPYENFELRLDWKVAPGGNSGVFYHVTEDKSAPWETGPELQVLDDERHADGKHPKTSAGANYALHAPTARARGAGRWNEVRLVVQDGHVTHFLNGVQVVDYRLWTDEWKALVAASKFAGMPDYGLRRTGHIVLQDHGDRVWYRNLRIRRLE